MIEAIVILGLIGLIAWKDHLSKQERSKMLNAILAKNTEDFKNLQNNDKPKPKEEKKKEDMVPVEQLNESEWYKAVVDQE